MFVVFVLKCPNPFDLLPFLVHDLYHDSYKLHGNREHLHPQAYELSLGGFRHCRLGPESKE